MDRRNTVRTHGIRERQIIQMAGPDPIAGQTGANAWPSTSPEPPLNFNSRWGNPSANTTPGCLPLSRLRYTLRLRLQYEGGTAALGTPFMLSVTMLTATFPIQAGFLQLRITHGGPACPKALGVMCGTISNHHVSADALKTRIASVWSSAARTERPRGGCGCFAQRVSRRPTETVRL
jgi:hypothetical protein